MLTSEDRFDRLDKFIAEDRLIRGNWTGWDDSDRETACLLAALSPEAGDARESAQCPASLLPSWLAHLTPWMNDYVSDDYWPDMIREYAWCVRRLHTLSDDTLKRLDYETGAIVLRSAQKTVPDDTAREAIDRAIAVLDRCASGGTVTNVERSRAASGAHSLAFSVRELDSNTFRALRAAEVAISTHKEYASEALGWAHFDSAGTDIVVRSILSAMRREIEAK